MFNDYADIDECTVGTAVCPNHADCVNKENGYSCQCTPGYTADLAGNCINIDECLEGKDDCNDLLSTCTDTDGGYM